MDKEGFTLWSNFSIHRWIEDCLQDEIDPIIKLEESMRNGIVLARLAEWFAPGVVRKIFQVLKNDGKFPIQVTYGMMTGQ